jgi:hypothetical protein
LSLDEAQQVDPATIKDRCIRIRLESGEVYDLELDCLQLTVQQLGTEEEPEPVTLGDFDMSALFGGTEIEASWSNPFRVYPPARAGEPQAKSRRNPTKRVYPRRERGGVAGRRTTGRSRPNSCSRSRAKPLA